MNRHHFECGNFSRSLVSLSKNNFYKNNFYKNNKKILFYFSKFSMVDWYFFKPLKCQIHLVKSIQVNLSIEVKSPKKHFAKFSWPAMPTWKFSISPHYLGRSSLTCRYLHSTLPSWERTCTAAPTSQSTLAIVNKLPILSK